MCEGELGGADGVRDVDVEGGVAAAGDGVGGFGTAGWVPEIGPVRVVDAGAGADNVWAC